LDADTVRACPMKRTTAMSWLGDFARDAAYYFGVGDGSDPARGSERQAATRLRAAARIVGVLAAAVAVRRVLGFDENLAGFLAAAGFVVALAAAGGMLLHVRDRRAVQGRSGDG
jgi:hypothetical protein